MIEGLKPYAEYKESGVPWLGKIPKHWEVRRGKSVFNCIDVRSKAGEEELLTVSSKDGVVPRREKNVTMFMAESYEGYKLCWPGDLVINSLWAWAGGLGFSRHHGIISSAYGVYRPNEEFSDHWKYFDYLLRSIVYDWEFHVRSKGIWVSRLQLTDPSFLEMPIVLPPNSEAVAIAQFLTGASARISRLIRDKRRLIELLNEQKCAIIHQAVTRGLDPNVNLKPSGIDWLSEIPEHWFSVRAGTLALSLQTGPFGSQLHAHDYTPNGIPVINPSHMANGRIIADPNCAIDLNKAIELSRHRLHPGDIVFARRGELGRCALVGKREEGWLCGTGSLRMRLKDDVADPEYLMQLFLSKGVAEWLSLQSVGSTMDNLNTGIFARLPLPLPPKDEQRAIFLHLIKQQALVDSAIDRAQREIALIREYRTRLISDVVTGKLDVRGVELSAMDEAEVLGDIEIGEETEAEELIESEEVADADE